MQKNKKNTIPMIVGVILLLVIAGGFYFSQKKEAAPEFNYQAAVMVRSQRTSDPAEDKKTSLKVGDVLVIKKGEDLKWSKNESVSYLILKMELTEEQSQMLTQAKEKEIPFEALSDEEKQRIEEEKKRAAEAGEEYRPEPRKETLIAREYYIDLGKHFTGFKPMDLVNKGQPFMDKVYDWSIVSKKE